MVKIPCRGCISLPICISKTNKNNYTIDNILLTIPTIPSSIRKTNYQLRKIEELFGVIGCSLFVNMMKGITYPREQEYNFETMEWEITYCDDTKINYVFYELISIFHLNKVK